MVPVQGKGTPPIHLITMTVTVTEPIVLSRTKLMKDTGLWTPIRVGGYLGS